jgi:hypothetical protein
MIARLRIGIGVAAGVPARRGLLEHPEPVGWDARRYS